MLVGTNIGAMLDNGYVMVGNVDFLTVRIEMLGKRWDKVVLMLYDSNVRSYRIPNAISQYLFNIVYLTLAYVNIGCVTAG